MSFLDSVWIITCTLIIIIILGTDPKNPSNNIGNNQMSIFFSSVSEGQKFLQQSNYFLIISFFLLTLGISYFS